MLGWKTTDFSLSKLSLRRAIDLRLGGAMAKKPKNDYLAFQAKGSRKKFAAGPGFGFATTVLHLSGDVTICVDAGLFSTKKKVVEAAGDGEFACVELSTVGSGPTEQFVSLCGRLVDGQGYQAFAALPGGETQGNVLLPNMRKRLPGH